MNSQRAQTKLNKIYIPALTGFRRAMRSYSQDTSELSGPFLINAAATTYAQSQIKLILVGQQTNTWKMWADLKRLRPDALQRRLLAVYQGCNLLTIGRSAFWSAVRRLREVNGPGDVSCEQMDFVWTNLVKIDDGNRLPGAEMMNIVAEHLYLLKQELSILKPDAVVFLTGPNYDWCLEEQFSDISFELVKRKIDKNELARLVHPALPFASFRTYHPGYLYRSRNQGCLDIIVERIRRSTH